MAILHAKTSSMIHKYIYFLREICSSWKGELTVRLWEWKGKETMVLHWWDITSLFGLINRLDDVNWPLLRVSKLTYCALKLWWKAPNISFRNYLLWPTYIIISVDQTKLSNSFVTYCSNFFAECTLQTHVWWNLLLTPTNWFIL